MEKSGEQSVMRPSDSATTKVLLRAGIELIAENGYHGTTVGAIASAAQLSPAALYLSFESKHALLFTIIDRGGETLLQMTEDALYRAPSDPVSRLNAIVATHVRQHLHFPRESFIGNTELRSLDPGSRRLAIVRRDSQQRLFDRAIGDGASVGVFETQYPLETSRAVVTACTAVANWYRPDGLLSADEVIERYQHISLHAVGYHGKSHS